MPTEMPEVTHGKLEAAVTTRLPRAIGLRRRSRGGGGRGEELSRHEKTREGQPRALSGMAAVTPLPCSCWLACLRSALARSLTAAMASRRPMS